MSDTVVAPTDTPPAEALELREAASVATPYGTEIPQDLQEAYSEEERAKWVPLHLIRPCVGRGKGRHLYEARMLEENAPKFKDWKMYVDHLSPEARRAAGGLPRSVRDLGGRIVESRWDPNVPADPQRGLGQGAVVGWAIPSPFIRELVDNDPEIVEASISANATGVRPVNKQGQRVWLVEGIQDRGSVDWVTEAGAGGRVVALMEAAYSEGDDMDLVESMTDEEFIAYVQENRPHLLEADAEDAADGGADEFAEEVARLQKKGLSRAAAEAQAKKNLAEAAQEGTTPNEEENTVEITPEKLQEALQDESFKSVIDGIVNERISEQLPALVESAVSEERELIRAEAKADAGREIELRDMRDSAHGAIRESRLPERIKDRLYTRFNLTEAGPTADLDVVDDVDGEGAVTKPARTKLQESLQEAIQEEQEIVASINPTRVKGQGPSAPGASKEGDDAKPGEGTAWGSLLQEAGVDPAKAYEQV